MPEIRGWVPYLATICRFSLNSGVLSNKKGTSFTNQKRETSQSLLARSEQYPGRLRYHQLQSEGVLRVRTRENTPAPTTDIPRGDGRGGD